MSSLPLKDIHIPFNCLNTIFTGDPAFIISGLCIIILVLLLYTIIFFNKKKTAELKLEELNRGLKRVVRERTDQLNSNEKRFSAMIAHATDIISLLDDKFQVTYVNHAIEDITGYTAEEMVNKKSGAIVHPDDAGTSDILFTELNKNPGMPVHRSARLIHKNGSIIWVEGVLINLLHDPNVRAIISNYRDVTARKISEAGLIASEQKYRNTLDKMIEGIQIIDFDYRYIYLNEAVTKQSRNSADELAGHTMMEKYPGIENSDMFKLLEKCMTERSPQFMVNHFLYPDQSEAWFELSMQPVPEGVFIHSIDISERKNAQDSIKKLNDELEHKVTERTEQLQMVNKELESFSYSVSHDLRAPLRAVNGYAKMIEEDYVKVLDDEGKRLLGNIQYNAQKMGTLIDDLLSFSRLGRKEVQKSNINVAELLEGVFIELNKNIKYKASVKTGELHPLSADYALMNQVFYNLISNAIKYSSKKEDPTVEISSEKKEHEVVYRIADNGAGFDMKYGHKLFGVFQRLHSDAEFEGTGVGLAIVQRIVTKHGGKAWAEGEPGKGASFYFSIPE